jgi:hypothetical protein
MFPLTTRRPLLYNRRLDEGQRQHGESERRWRRRQGEPGDGDFFDRQRLRIGLRPDS